jgi:hypothetical protein
VYTTQHNNPEIHECYLRCCENLKSCIQDVLLHVDVMVSMSTEDTGKIVTDARIIWKCEEPFIIF